MKYFNLQLKALSDNEQFVEIEGLASTEDKDRVGDVLKVEKWNLTNYKNNPVLLYNHNPDKPVGVVQQIGVVENGLKFFGIVHKLTGLEFIYEAVANGILKTASVGYIEKGDEYELIEISLTPVPANPNAIFEKKEFEGDASDKEITENTETEEKRAGVKLNQACIDWAEDCIKNGKYKTIDEGWELTAEGEDEIIEKEGWEGFAKIHLAINENIDNAEAKARYMYPIGKFGYVYRKALVSAMGYASKLGDNNVYEEARKLAEKIDRLEAEKSGSGSYTDVYSNEPEQIEEKNIKKERKMIDKNILKDLIIIKSITGAETKDILEHSYFKQKAVNSSDIAGWLDSEVDTKGVSFDFVKSVVMNSTTYIDMPAVTFRVPKINFSTVVETGENTNITASDFTGAQFTLTAAPYKAKYQYSAEVDISSAISLLPVLKTKLELDIQKAFDYVVFEGDTTKTDIRKIKNGLRKAALAGTKKADLSALNFANVMALRGLLGKFGVNPADLIIYCDPIAYFKLAGLDELKTIDKYGVNATVVTGEVAKLGGIPVLCSDMIPATNASGVVDTIPANNTKGTIFIVNKNALITGGYGGLTYRYVQDGNFTDTISAMYLLAFDFDSDGIAIGYNI